MTTFLLFRGQYFSMLTVCKGVGFDAKGTKYMLYMYSRSSGQDISGQRGVIGCILSVPTVYFNTSVSMPMFYLSVYYFIYYFILFYQCDFVCFNAKSQVSVLAA